MQFKTEIQGNLKNFQRKKVEVIGESKKFVSKVRKGYNDSLVAFRPNPGKKNSSLRVILRNDTEEFKNVKIGEFWEIEYFERADKTFAWGVPIKRMEIESSLYITTEGSGSVGIKSYIPELGSVGEGLLFMMTFPGGNREMTDLRRKWVMQKIAKYHNTAYQTEILEDYVSLLEKLKDDERAFNQLEKELKSSLQSLPKVDSHNKNVASESEVVEMLLEEVSPFQADTIPLDKSPFIKDSLEGYGIIGTKTQEGELFIVFDTIVEEELV